MVGVLFSFCYPCRHDWSWPWSLSYFLRPFFPLLTFLSLQHFPSSSICCCCSLFSSHSFKISPISSVAYSVFLAQCRFWNNCIGSLCTIALLLSVAQQPIKPISSTQPPHLNSMLTPARTSRHLRSISSNPLYILRVKTKSWTRAFSVTAPTLCNSLPVGDQLEGNIVSFRRRLNIYLFS